jgi:hypothetical protein
LIKTYTTELYSFLNHAIAEGLHYKISKYITLLFTKLNSIENFCYITYDQPLWRSLKRYSNGKNRDDEYKLNDIV